jgi:hypothetical protein
MTTTTTLYSDQKRKKNVKIKRIFFTLIEKKHERKE